MKNYLAFIIVGIIALAVGMCSTYLGGNTETKAVVTYEYVTVDETQDIKGSLQRIAFHETETIFTINGEDYRIPYEYQIKYDRNSWFGMIHLNQRRDGVFKGMSPFYTEPLEAPVSIRISCKKITETTVMPYTSCMLK